MLARDQTLIHGTKTLIRSCESQPQPRRSGATDLEQQLQLGAAIAVLGIVLELRVGRDQGVLRANVQVVVESPVHGPHPPRRVPQTLHQVLQHLGGPQRHAEAVDRVEDRHDQVRGGLEDVGPDVVHQVLQRVLAVQPLDAQSQVLDGPRRRLPVHEVAVHQRVFKDGGDCMDVVLAHLADVLEHEAQTLKHAILHVQLGHPVLVHQRRQHGERTARLRHDGDSHRGTDTQLTLLHLQVVEQRAEHIVRADCLRNVAEGIHGGTANRLLVGLEELQQVEADAVPLARRRQLGAAVGNSSNQVDAVLLDLLVPVLQDRRQARQQVLDRRRHLGHTNHVDDGLHGSQDRPQHLRVLFAQVLVEEEAQVTHHLLLAALLHDDRNARDQVSGLLTHARRRRVQAPPDDTGDLWQVRLDARTQRVHHRAEAVQHDGGVVRRLLLEGVDDAVDDLLLEARVDVGHAQVANHLVDGLHDHLAVRLGGVLQVLDHPADDVRATDLVGNLDGRVDQLPVVPAVQGHAHDPEVAEEGRQDILADVAGLDALRGDALLHDLQHNLLHLLIWRGELADQNDHDLSRVVVRVLRVHERDDVADGLQEGSQALATVLADALPQRAQHGVKGLDTVGAGGLGQGGERQRGDGAHLLLLVLQAVRNDVDHLFQVRQHGAAH
mmetsp:Transcript_24317/g.61665  ORF Transcript_24317/g.61665 Transcript_24317/m.61665 type:complete len:665 (+) Transcript_24317:276-2270(+)